MAMETFLPFLMGFAMFATLAVVVVGIISFAVHGKFYRKHSNHMMRLRVLFQAIALVIFAILMAYVAH
jgi:ABC-type dipeptide/oligopeptide/nickel transport system permease subunit